MRTLGSFLLALLLATSLAAQNYTQNAPPQQQIQVASDCYTKNLDNGNAALRRGESREALRFFNEAKNCPDAQNNARRQSELDARIERCQEQLGLTKTTAEQVKISGQSAVKTQKRTFSNEIPSTRRNYNANKNFLKDTLEDCFRRMVTEADLAYKFKFWEDAAALYRAAKNCADADQNDRQRMSEKINACRNAAENELFAKQQEAERQARHAIAANLADDAQELLHSNDRSLAFRLADFANQYIAPDDNMDCVQAMFDAWYYQSPEDAKHREDELYHPVFCYELADNLGENTQVKFQQQKDGTQWLWALVPKTGDMFAWEMPGMKMVYSSGTGEGNGFTGFDFSPNGDLLFWGNKFFELRRGARSRRIELSVTTHWCFNARGDEFFYENVADQKIYVLNVRDVFAQSLSRKGSKNANVFQAPAEPRAIVSDLPKGLLAMQYINGKFWLGFRDRVEVLGKTEAGKPWKRERVIPFDGLVIPEFADPKEFKLVLYPKQGFAVMGSNQGCWRISLAENPGDSLRNKTFESMYPLAVCPSTHQVACQFTGNYGFNGFWVLDAQTGDTLLRQRIPSYTSFEVLKGCFSSDGHWVAASSYNGNLNVWALQDASTTWKSQLPRQPEDQALFSPNGNYLFARFADTLAILETDRSKEQDLYWKGKPLRGASDHWAILQVSPDSAEARQLTDGRKLRFPLKIDGSPSLFDIDAKGDKFMAYLSDWNKVEVRSLKTGALVASKSFDGGYIGELHFIPGSDNLIVVQHIGIGESEIGQSSVKVWSPVQAGEKPRALRLHDYYSIGSMAINETGKLAAFSNGIDIRVFDLQNIENEFLRIKDILGEHVQAIVFRPNTSLLAAAYSTGKVVFWDTQTRQAALLLQVVPNRDLSGMGAEITNIGFSQNGAVLQLVLSDGRLLAYALDPSFIRLAAQDENRHLQSFGADQIVRYNLEAALYYPGNFERLAESGDAPLVRSFFRHFRYQALESNSILQVRDYCDRAFYLYERLDENTKLIWRQDMQFMYEDYAKKLLLRGNINEATGVVKFIQREFDFEPGLLNAHIALLRREYSKASALYTNYLLTNKNIPVESYEVLTTFESVERDLMKFRDYELIDSMQKVCFCSTVRLSGTFAEFCPEGKNSSSAFLSASDRLLWEIFHARFEAENNLSFGIKSGLLSEALQKSKELARQNPMIGQAWLETITYEFAQNHRAWGVFEENSPDALIHFEKAAQLLNEVGAFKKISDSSRISLLTSIHLAWGKQLLKTGKSADAMDQFNLGFQAFQPLAEAVAGDTSLLRIYYDNLIGPLYEQSGTALLLEGHPTEARQSFDQANIYYNAGLNSYFQATVAVYENDETQAFLDLGIIADPSEIGNALYLTERIAEKFPEKRAWIEAFVPRLRSAWLSNNPRLSNDEIEYWLAKYKVDQFAAQSKWDSAVAWSTIALRSAKRCAERPKSDDVWTHYLLDEHINMPYFLLLQSWNKPEVLEECIRYVDQAKDILSKQDSSTFFYTNRELLNTNLANALILRNKPDDHHHAIELYKEFLHLHADYRGYDNWDLLEKDFRELRRAGAPWPALPELERMVDGGR